MRGKEVEVSDLWAGQAVRGVGAALLPRGRAPVGPLGGGGCQLCPEEVLELWGSAWAEQSREGQTTPSSISPREGISTARGPREDCRPRLEGGSPMGWRRRGPALPGQGEEAIQGAKGRRGGGNPSCCCRRPSPWLGESSGRRPGPLKAAPSGEGGKEEGGRRAGIGGAPSA